MPSVLLQWVDFFGFHKVAQQGDFGNEKKNHSPLNSSISVVKKANGEFFSSLIFHQWVYSVECT